MKKTLLLFCLASLPCAFAAKKTGSWQSGKVVDYMMTLQDLNADKITGRRIEPNDHVVTIEGGGQLFVAQEKAAWHGSCLLIVGDDVKFMQRKNELHVQAADGLPCDLEILRTEKK